MMWFVASGNQIHWINRTDRQTQTCRTKPTPGCECGTRTGSSMAEAEACEARLPPFFPTP